MNNVYGMCSDAQASSKAPAPSLLRRRRCVGCGRSAEKGTLYRLVRDQGGSVSFDASGKKPGRGAYVCSMACFDRARRGRKLDRALRVSLNSQNLDALSLALRLSDIEENGE